MKSSSAFATEIYNGQELEELTLQHH